MDLAGGKNYYCVFSLKIHSMDHGSTWYRSGIVERLTAKDAMIRSSYASLGLI